MIKYILKARRIQSDICYTFNFKMEAKDGGVRAWITVFGVFLNYFFMFGFLRCFSVLIDPIIVQYETNYKGMAYFALLRPSHWVNWENFSIERWKMNC